MAATNSKKVKDQQVLAIDIGTRFIKVVEVGYRQGLACLNNVLIFPTPEESIDNSAILDPVAIGKELRLRLIESKIKTKKTFVTLRGLSTVLVRPIEMPRMTAKELKKAIPFEVEQQVPFEPTDTVVDYAPIVPIADVPEDAENMKILLAAAKEEAIDNYLKILKIAKLVPFVMDVENLSAMRPIINIHSENSRMKSSVVALVNIGASCTDVNIIKNGNIAFTRSIPIGGDNITNAISEEMGRTFEEAEDLKRLHGKIYLEEIVAELPSPVGEETAEDVVFGSADLINNVAEELSTFDIDDTAESESMVPPASTSFDIDSMLAAENAENRDDFTFSASAVSGTPLDEDEAVASSIFGDLTGIDEDEIPFSSDDDGIDTGSSAMSDDGEDDESEAEDNVFDVSSFIFGGSDSDKEAETDEDAEDGKPFDLLSSMDSADSEEESNENTFVFDSSSLSTTVAEEKEEIADAEGETFNFVIPETLTVENVEENIDESGELSDPLSFFDNLNDTDGDTPEEFTVDNNVEADATVTDATVDFFATNNVDAEESFGVTDLLAGIGEENDTLSDFAVGDDDDDASLGVTDLLAGISLADSITEDKEQVYDATKELLQEQAANNAAALAAANVNELFVRRIYESFTPVIEDLVKEIRISLDYYSTMDPEIVSEIKLYGGTCLLPNLAEFISREIGVETSVANVTLDMDITDCKQSDIYIDEVAPLLVIATGLAMRDMITE